MGPAREYVSLHLVAVVGKVTEWIDRQGYRKWTEFTMAGTMLALGFYLLWQA